MQAPLFSDGKGLFRDAEGLPAGGGNEDSQNPTVLIRGLPANVAGLLHDQQGTADRGGLQFGFAGKILLNAPILTDQRMKDPRLSRRDMMSLENPEDCFRMPFEGPRQDLVE